MSNGVFLCHYIVEFFVIILASDSETTRAFAMNDHMPSAKPQYVACVIHVIPCLIYVCIYIYIYIYMPAVPRYIAVPVVLGHLTSDIYNAY